MRRWQCCVLHWISLRVSRWRALCRDITGGKLRDTVLAWQLSQSKRRATLRRWPSAKISSLSLFGGLRRRALSNPIAKLSHEQPCKWRRPLETPTGCAANGLSVNAESTNLTLAPSRRPMYRASLRELSQQVLSQVSGMDTTYNLHRGWTKFSQASIDGAADTTPDRLVSAWSDGQNYGESHGSPSVSTRGGR